jgi:hypothetical protein
MSDIAVAALLAGTILLASTVSIEIGISVALIELLLGVVVGNSFQLDVPSWLAFIGSFAGVVLTFLAGAEEGARCYAAWLPRWRSINAPESAQCARISSRRFASSRRWAAPAPRSCWRSRTRRSINSLSSSTTYPSCGAST